jgi:hypothetical protein
LSKLIGKTVEIIDEESPYIGFRGEIIRYDGLYHVSKGNFDVKVDLAPVFTRKQFQVVEFKFYRVYLESHFFVVKAQSKVQAKRIAKGFPAYKDSMKHFRQMGITKPKVRAEEIKEEDPQDKPAGRR